EGGNSILIEAINAFTNPTIGVLFMGAILMAIISTADSLLCSISSNVACDFILKNQENNLQSLKLCRWITLFIGVASLALAYQFDNVVAVLMVSYELSVCVLVIPVLYAIYRPNPSRTGAVLAMAGGVCGFFL